MGRGGWTRGRKEEQGRWTVGRGFGRLEGVLEGWSGTFARKGRAAGAAVTLPGDSLRFFNIGVGHMKAKYEGYGSFKRCLVLLQGIGELGNVLSRQVSGLVSTTHM